VATCGRGQDKGAESLRVRQNSHHAHVPRRTTVLHAAGFYSAAFSLQCITVALGVEA
jgi:hypothetical protein